MTKHLSDKEILDALGTDPITIMEIAHNLGRQWDSGLRRRLVLMCEKGVVKRKRIGNQFYLYWREASK